MLTRCLKEYGGNDIFHIFAWRFTKQLSLGNKICSNKKPIGTKTLKAHVQPYLELKRIYIESSPQSNELLFHDR